MYVSQHVFLSFHSVLMFRFASSIKENGNWLSKTTLEEVGCRSDADSIYPESHFWVVAAAGAGRYSCPVATMFCEKLLTRRDIAENLRASVIGIRLCCWNKKMEMFWSHNVMFEKSIVSSSLHASTQFEKLITKKVFTSFESCCSNMKT